MGKKHSSFVRHQKRVKRKLRIRRELVESSVFKLKYHLEDSGDTAPQESGEAKAVRIEVQNDPKYLLGILNGIDTAKEPYRNRRRTIMRLFTSCTKVSREWAKTMKDTDIPNEQQDFVLEEMIPISPEGFEFLKELVDKPPEGARFQSIPIQNLLIAIEDQYDEWKKESGDARTPAKTEEPPPGS